MEKNSVGCILKLFIMKIIIFILFSISLYTYGQNKKPINTNGIDKDHKMVMDSLGKSKPDTAYQITLSKEEFLSIVDIVRSLDEKPSVIKAWLQEHIYSKTRQVLIPKEIKK